MTVSSSPRRLLAKAKSLLRWRVWSVWPSFPTEWSQVPVRVRPAAVQISRLTIAAVISFLAANAWSPGIRDLTAPLTALLVVQASTVGTLRTGLVRVGAVLTGVLVAVGVSSVLGLTWWSLALVIASSLILAKVFRLGGQTLEAPISAMLILAVSTPELAGEVRLVNTLIGSVVGVAFSVLVPVAIPNARARDAVRGVARSQAALLDEVAAGLGRRAPHPEEVKAWFEWVEHLGGEIDEAVTAVQAAEEGRALNPRALAAARVHTGLRAVLVRLDRCLAAERALLVVISTELPGIDGADESDAGAELRRVFAMVFDDIAGALRAFSDLVEAEYGADRGRADEALSRTLDIVSETRAVLTELRFLDVGTEQQSDTWMLRGPVLAAVESLLGQLDLEQTERSSQAWLRRRPLAALPDAWQRKGDPGHRRG